MPTGGGFQGCCPSTGVPVVDNELRVLCDADGVQFLRRYTIDGDVVTVTDTELDGTTPYAPVEPVEVCGPTADESPAESCVKVISQCGCDDTTGDGQPDTQYTELFCVASDGTATLLLTYSGDPTVTYVPVNPVPCESGCVDQTWLTLCDEQGAFLRRVITAGSTTVVEDYELDATTTYMPVGDVGACAGDESPGEPCDDTTPFSTIGLCLADGTPIAVVATRACDGTVTQDGWINLTTGAFSAGAPPAGTIACGETRSIQVSGVFCDLDADGNVLGLVLIEYQYNSDGSIASVTLLDATTGQPYTVQGELSVCPAGVEQPDSDLTTLCDEDGTPFVRDYHRDENGQIVGFSDYDLDGVSFTPVGVVGLCEESPGEPCRNTSTLLVCDIPTDAEPDPTVTDTDPTVFFGGPSQVPHPGGGQVLWDGGTLTIPGDNAGSGGTVITQRSLAAIVQADQPACDTGTATVTVSLDLEQLGPDVSCGGVGALRLFNNGVFLVQDVPPSGPPVGWTGTLTVSASVPSADVAAGNIAVGFVIDTYQENSGCNGGVPVSTGWELDNFVAGVEFDVSGDCTTQILANVVTDCDGNVVSVTYSTLDGTPYTPTGEVGECTATGGACCPPEPCRNTSTLLVCDLPVDGDPDAVVTDTSPDSYWPAGQDGNQAVPGGAQVLWDGGTLTVPPDTGPPPDGFPQHTRTAAVIIQASQPACDDGTATVTATVRVQRTGPDPGCVGTGGLFLHNGTTTRIAADGIVRNTPVGHVQTLTVTAQVPAADVAAGTVAASLRVETYHLAAGACPGGSNPDGARIGGWTVDEFAADVVFDQADCATQVFANVVTDCETGQVESVTYTTPDGQPYEPTGEIGQCQATGGECCPPDCPRSFSTECVAEVATETTYDNTSCFEDGECSDCGSIQGPLLRPGAGPGFDCSGTFEVTSWLIDGTEVVTTPVQFTANGCGDQPGRLHTNWANALTTLDTTAIWEPRNKDGCAWYVGTSGTPPERVYGQMVITSVDDPTQVWTLGSASFCEETPYTKVFTQECDGSVTVSFMDEFGQPVDTPPAGLQPCGTCSGGSGDGCCPEECRNATSLLLCDEGETPEQTEAIPFPLPDGPTQGLLANGVAWTVNSGRQIADDYSISPAGSAPPNGPQTWTFDQPVMLRFGITGLNGDTECAELPADVDLVSLAPSHTWDPGTRMLCGPGSSTHVDTSVFATPSPVTSLTWDAVGVPGFFRGVEFMDVTVGEPPTQFLRNVTLDCDGNTISVVDTTLDGQPFEPTGEVAQCTAVGGPGADVVDCDGQNALLVKVCDTDESPAEPPCRNTSTLLVCDIPTDGVAGDLTATDTAASFPPGNPTPQAWPPLAGGGAALWSGGTLVFPADPNGSAGDGVQVYRGVAATLQATRPACDDDTATVTVSVHVVNDGPGDGLGMSGALMLMDAAGTLIHSAGLRAAGAPYPPGFERTLTVTGPVDAADLAAGTINIGLWLETFHGTPKQWTADEFTATYEFGSAGCETQVFANVVTDCETGEVESITYTDTEGNPYEPTGEIGECQPITPEPCQVASTFEKCRCDDLSDESPGEVVCYTEIWGISCEGGAPTLIHTYQDDPATEYVPTNPVDCADVATESAQVVGVKTQRLELAPGDTWDAAAYPLLQSVTAVGATGEGQITTDAGTSTLYQGEHATWSVVHEFDLTLQGPLTIEATTGAVTVTWTEAITS